jgi:hypothetical protein
MGVCFVGFIEPRSKSWFTLYEVQEGKLVGAAFNQDTCAEVRIMKFSNPYNMYIQPQLHDAWDTGFCCGFCGPTGTSISLPVPALIANADCVKEFNEGIAAGQSAAAFGWDVVDPPCMEAREGEPAGESKVEYFTTGGHMIGDIATDVVHAIKISEDVALAKAFGMAAVAAMIVLVYTGYGLVWTKPVEQTELPAFGQSVVSILNSRGIFSCAIYMGAAADPSARGKELCVTPLFRTKWDASKAAKGIGRSQWAVMEWRTDRSGGFSIVDGPGW